MKNNCLACLLWLSALSLQAHADAANFSDAYGLKLLNQINYSAFLTTSGQPTEAELAQIVSAGYERVIFLAFTNHPTALNHEDDIVKALGSQFIHIPVEWESPRLADFDAFAAVMQIPAGGKTLVHCEVNFRASVFGFLYQVLYEGADLDEAMSLMHAIWIPNDDWEAFIARVMSDKGADYQPL